MNYFFVYQNQSYKLEYEGSYLWAPKRNSKGQIKSHWKSMKEIVQGDIIYSCVDQHITAIAIAKTDCYDAPRPVESEFQSWWEDGYRVDVDYRFLKTKLPINSYRKELISLMPDYNAPLAYNGRSNTGYMFNINKEVSDFLAERIEDDIRDILAGAQLTYPNDNDEIMELNETVIDDTIPPTYTPTPETKKESVEDTGGNMRFPRDLKVSIAALKRANHKCEFNSNHTTFTRKRDGKPYTEPHHLIPLSKNHDFDYCLDVQANIISLCSHCHNLLHYGSNFEEVLQVLYEQRKDALSQAGIGLDFERLMRYYK